MKSHKVHLGSSGWSYKHWKEKFYPEKMKPAEYLTYYARHYDITEINTSFYHTPRTSTVEGWANKVPKGFKFCPKMSRYLTHIKRLKEPEEPLEVFFNAFEPMLKMIGPVLVQLPPSLKFDKDVASNFYEVLHRKYKTYKFAMEVRHLSWLTEESFELMRSKKISFVISQSGVGFPYAEELTAKDVYIRFHGPKELYSSLYTDEMLEYYAGKIKAWVKAGHIIWAFFNNDWNCNALKNADTLKQMVGNI